MLTIKTSLGTQSKACPDTFGLHAVRLSLKNDFFRLNKERETLLKLIIGMAISGYSYDPQAKRNEATSDIVSDLELNGIPLDPDTVSKWIKEASDQLPSDVDN